MPGDASIGVVRRVDLERQVHDPTRQQLDHRDAQIRVAVEHLAEHPARDLGPRIAHAILPIKGKGSSDWAYSWVPVVGPLIGGVIAALLAPVLLHLAH